MSEWLKDSLLLVGMLFIIVGVLLFISTVLCTVLQGVFIHPFSSIRIGIILIALGVIAIYGSLKLYERELDKEL